MHLALAEVEVDLVVGDNAGEALGDPAKLENGPLVHCAILWRWAGRAWAEVSADGVGDFP